MLVTLCRCIHEQNNKAKKRRGSSQNERSHAFLSTYFWKHGGITMPPCYRRTQQKGICRISVALHSAMLQCRFKALPHNSSAALAMPFLPSASCRNLDLPPVNLRFLQSHLTKNAFAIAPTHLCGIALTNFKHCFIIL